MQVWTSNSVLPALRTERDSEGCKRASGGRGFKAEDGRGMARIHRGGEEDEGTFMRYQDHLNQNMDI